MLFVVVASRLSGSRADQLLATSSEENSADSGGEIHLPEGPFRRTAYFTDSLFRRFIDFGIGNFNNGIFLAIGINGDPVTGTAGANLVSKSGIDGVA